MTHFCKYHPLEAAAWHCPSCRILCCEQCSPERPGDAKGSPHYCLMCGGELKHLSGALGAMPFWQRPLDFLRYPLSPLAIALLVAGALLPLLLVDGSLPDPSSQGFGKLLVALAAYLLLLTRFAYTALEYTASGRLAPLTVPEVLKAENTDLSLRLGLLLLAAAAVVIYVVFAGIKSVFWGSTLATLELVAVPAMVLAAAIDKNMAAAFSTESLGNVVKTLGPLYGAFVFLLLLLMGGLQSFVSLLADVLPLPFTYALSVLVYGYFLVVMMATCGYLLYQYQVELGFTPVHGSQRGRRGRAGAVDLPAVQVDIYLKEGAYAKAVATLRAETSRKGATLTVHERYHRLISALGDEQAMRQHANVYFKMLLEGNRDIQALAMMREYLLRDSSFRPDDPDVCYDLAQSFLALGEYKMSVHMINGLHKDAPHYVRLPEAYLLAARVLDENLGLPQKSMALVQFLEGRFKTHKAYPEIMAFKGRLMQKLA